jgi:hypothetical protein
MAELPTGVSIPHTSVPRRGAVAPDWSGTTHLVVVEEPESLPSELDPLASTSDCEVLSSDRLGACERLLKLRLDRAHVGLRLYLVGGEAFSCRLELVAFGAGLLPSEIQTKILPGEIRVWCTHCKAVTEFSGCNLVNCCGCGRHLTVYHHFSRRHGAYMGFQADAELPGELPEREGGLPWT